MFGKLAGQRFGTIMADPPWQFTNKTGKARSRQNTSA